eukprot:snap_masked-scaffold1302_size49677-processed-gene-0.3 protein:Tk08428 transcript:snap_masked-scaffold1302_size49677-processed-gene-0.3-mRNA-1 annotation:"protein phosphatase slingshot homolog 1 isoform 2"
MLPPDLVPLVHLAVGDQLIQTIRLESAYPDRTRHLCIVRSPGEEAGAYCLLGVDRHIPDGSTSIGLCLPLLWDLRISLDGDGGFSFRQHRDIQHLIFKPASVQALWTIIQTLSLVAERLEVGQPPGPGYPVTSSQSCLNEWHWMADILVRRPASPRRFGPALGGGAGGLSTEDEVRTKLKTIMRTADLDAITSKSIRTQLECEMGQDLEALKSHIDREILLILGQMDPASLILDYLYLGSEWNASNLEELQQNGITHILNVTREIDNFYPSVFTYHNIREYDEEATDLLKYLDRTYRFIRAAQAAGGKVLVHCKMGISRSATVVVSYVMKEYRRPLVQALEQVKYARSIVNPNKSFRKQLEVYEGILGAISHRHTAFGLFRSKSESSLVQSSDSISEPGESGRKRDSQESMSGAPSLTSDSTFLRPPVSKKFQVDIKALSNVFCRPTSEPLSLRSRSWSNPDQELMDESEPTPKVCRCFGQPKPEEQFVYAQGPGLPQGGMLDRTKSPPPVNTSGIDLLCRCNLEIELKVPDKAISVALNRTSDSNQEDGLNDNETNVIVQSLSNLPLQMRASGACDRLLYDSGSLGRRPHSAGPKSSKHPSDIFGPAFKRSNSQGILEGQGTPTLQPGSLDPAQEVPEWTHPPSPPTKSVRGDELSVKTLANMFDFKINSVPPFRQCSRRLLRTDDFFRDGKH